MTDPGDNGAWPSCDLTSCADCGQPLAPRLGGGHGRLYGCGCPSLLLDADDLDETIGKAVIDHLTRRLAPQSFTATRVEAAWRHATPLTRRALITTELAAVTISHDDAGHAQLAYVWHTEAPDIESPTRTTYRSSVDRSGGSERRDA